MARYKAPRIVGGILRFLFTVLVLGVCAIIGWRVFFSTKIPEEVAPLVKNDRLSAAYSEHGDKLTLRYQDLATITRAEKNYGYFSVESCVFIPEAEQVQIIFRYNNSTIRHLTEDYSLPALPQKSEHLFDVTLVKATDLTPENKDDNLDPNMIGTERILPSEIAPEQTYVSAESSLYTYYRYVFDGVTIEDVTDAFYVDIYYVNDLDYEADAYGTLCVYAWDEEWLAYRPSKADQAAMRSAD